MRKKYVAPKLFVDVYAADTMIASDDPTPVFEAKEGNPNNQNCYGYKDIPGAFVDGNICIM